MGNTQLRCCYSRYNPAPRDVLRFLIPPAPPSNLSKLEDTSRALSLWAEGQTSPWHTAQGGDYKGGPKA